MLNAATKKKFRSIGHNLKPVVLLGAKGLTEAVIEEVNVALDAHELIKVKIGAGEREDRQEIISEICAQTKAELVQTIGKIALIFRPSKKGLYTLD